MPTQSDLLTAIESCQRRAAWSRHWRKHRMTASQMLTEAVTDALCSNDPDRGQYAGDSMVTLATNRGLDTNDPINIHRAVMNHASIADLVTTAIREPWKRDGDVFTDASGSYLRRLVPVGHWNDERQRAEVRSWYALGEVCRTGLPMQIVVAVLGHNVGGRRHGHWSKALLHPQRSSLRFKLRARHKVEGFKESWQPVFREEHPEIDRERWLQSMMEDDVLRDILFVVKVEVPDDRERINELRKRQLDRVERLSELPDKQMSTCESPLGSCPFLTCCWGQPEVGPEAGGFDPVHPSI